MKRFIYIALCIGFSLEILNLHAQTASNYYPFTLGENTQVKQHFSQVFKELKLKKDSTFFTFHKQPFCWSNHHQIATFHYYNQGWKPLLTANQLAFMFPNQHMILAQVNPAETHVLLILEDAMNNKDLVVIQLDKKTVVKHITHVHDATWVNNASFVYVQNQAEIHRYHIKYQDNQLLGITPLDDHISFQKTWTDEILINLSNNFQSDVWFINQAIEIEKIPIIKPIEGIYYQLERISNTWVCLVKSQGDFHQILTSNTLNQTDWESFISTADQVYVNQMTSSPQSFILTGFKKEHTFIITFNNQLTTQHNIKFDETLYRVNLDQQPDLYKNVLQINNQQPEAPGFSYHLLNKKIIPAKPAKVSIDFNQKKYHAQRTQVTWGNNQALITLVYRNQVRKITNAIIIKPTSFPKELLRDHFTSDDLHYLEEGYAIALVHVIQHSTLPALASRNSKELDYPEIGLYHCTQQIMKNHPEKRVLAMAEGAHCNVLLNTIIDHPSLYESVVFKNPVFKTPYADYEQQASNNLSPVEQKYFSMQKSIDPLVRINAQIYPNILFLTNNMLPDRHTIAVFNKLSVNNNSTQNIFHFTSYYPTYIEMNQPLINTFFSTQQ